MSIEVPFVCGALLVSKLLVLLLSYVFFVNCREWELFLSFTIDVTRMVVCRLGIAYFGTSWGLCRCDSSLWSALC